MASIKDCIEAAASEDLDAATIKEIRTRLTEIAKQLRAKQGVTDFAEDMQKATAALETEIELSAKTERFRLALRITARDTLERRTKELEDAGLNKMEAVEALSVGNHSVKPGTQRSTDAHAYAEERKAIGEVLTRIEARDDGRLVRQFHDTDFNQSVGREMLGVATQDADAKFVAEILQDVKEQLRRQANTLGASIGKLENHVTQFHDPAALMALGRTAKGRRYNRKTGMEAWKAVILPRLHIENTFGVNALPGDIDTALDNIYIKIVEGVDQRISPVEQGAFQGAASLAQRLSSSRELHFKDPDAFLEYNSQFGSKDIIDSALSGMGRLGRDIAILRDWGPNPKVMHDSLAKEAIRDVSTRDLAKRRGPFKAFPALSEAALSRRFDALTGADQIPGNPSWARAMTGFRSWNAASKLGGAALSAISDVPITLSAAHTHGIGYFDALGQVLSTVGRGRARGERREITRSLGVGFDGVLNAVFQRLSGEDMVPGRIQWATTQVFKYSGLNWWTDVMREGFGLMVSNQLARQSKHAFEAVDTALLQQLQAHGIDADDWGKIQSASFRNLDGRDYITPDLFDGELERKLRSFFVETSEVASPAPRARERAQTLQGAQRGTLIGESWRSFAQFKQFPATMMLKVFPRVYNSEGGLGSASTLFAMLTFFGYAAMTAKDASKGRSPRDPAQFSTWASAMMQGGGLGLAGDLIFGDSNRYGNSFLATIGGPAAGQLEDIHKLYAAAVRGQDVASQFATFAQSNLPGMSMWWGRGAVNYGLMYPLQEMINPGRLQRMENAVATNNNQQFMFTPAATPFGL